MKKKLSKRKEGVLMEDLDSKLDLLVEGHSVLRKEIGDLRGEMNERFQEVDYKFEVVFEQMQLIRNNQVSRDEFIMLEKRVINLEKKLTAKK